MSYLEDPVLLQKKFKDISRYFAKVVDSF